MQKNESKNINIDNMHAIITPDQLKAILPLTSADHKIILNSRNAIIDIIHKKDPRLLVICGPCSIHDVDAAFDYADRLKSLSMELRDQLYIVMRVYLEKPRTVMGWKGLINDPYVNGSCDMESGLKIARRLLLRLIRIGLPLATEVLHPSIPQYIGEFFSWAAIGARTTESQIHREVASGLDMAVGFKNSTDGNICNAINSICAAKVSHHYININQFGQVCLVHTRGNPNGHIILRGGRIPNYYPKDIIYCEKEMKKVGLPMKLMIDCSHGNSNKDYRHQAHVAKSVVDQVKYGNNSIIGLMVESYINAGNQIINLSNPDSIQYGVSITDSCIDWTMTEQLLRYLHEELKPFLANRLVGAEME